MRREWINTVFICGLHALCLLGFLYTPRAVDVALFLGFYLLTGLGVTAGYHRLLTHRAFECPTWMRRAFAWLGASSLEGSPLVWVGTHRRHHRFSDLPNDPHSPREGFWHSHIGWMMVKRDQEVERAFAKDLARDPFMRWLDKAPIVPWIVTLGICLAVGGWRGLLWGGVIRTVWTWNITWAVNSFCHVFGRRTHETSDGSRNLWWVGILALGEGWHNNHHSYQRSALAGESVLQIDLSGYVIRALERVGLAWDVKRPKLKLGAVGGLLTQLRTAEGAASVLTMPSLSSFKGSAAVMDLIHALEDESAAFRARVIETLGRIGDARACEALEAHLKDSAREVAEAAETALRRLQFATGNEESSA